jgi:hypothetical protein
MRRVWSLRFMPDAVPPFVAFGLVAALLGGCTPGAIPPASTATVGSRPETRGDLGTLTYRAVDRIVAGVPELSQGKPVVVGTISEVQRLDRSTPFGNLVADLVRGRLAQKGVVVADMRLRSAVLLDRKEGEMTLANDRASVMAPPNAAGILTGTYAAGDEMIYVSLKLVSASDARIVAAVDFAVPRRGAETLLIPPS